jgi:hypothetical protein
LYHAILNSRTGDESLDLLITKLRGEIAILTKEEKEVIVSMYKAFFEPNSDSLYSAYINTVEALKTVDINLQPTNFYKMVVQNLATLEKLP